MTTARVHRSAFSRLPHTSELAISLLYNSFKTAKPEILLSDIQAKVQIDTHAFSQALKKVQKITGIRPLRESAGRDLVVHLPLLLAKLHEPLQTALAKDSKELDRRLLRTYTEQLLGFVSLSGLESGCHRRPVVAACMALAAAAMVHSGGINDCTQHELKDQDWQSLAEVLRCGQWTIKRRHNELRESLYRRAEPLKWLTVQGANRRNVHTWLKEFLSTETPGSLFQSSISSTHHPAAYTRHERLKNLRKKQLTEASFALKNGKDVETIDSDARLIYLLLAKDVPASEILQMSDKAIVSQVSHLYPEQEYPIATPVDLDAPEITENDMTDAEVNYYLR